MTSPTDIFVETKSGASFDKKGAGSPFGVWSSGGATEFAVETQSIPVPGNPMNILLIGGSGFIGRAIVEEARRKNHKVTIVSRGLHPIPEGVQHLKADRKIPGELANALCKINAAAFDLVVDCITETPADVQQDITLFSCMAGRLVILSTDMVFSPEKRSYPQGEACEAFIKDSSPAGLKRRAELMLFDASDYYSNWTILRPCHLYGPGHLTGCLPPCLPCEDFAKALCGETLPALPAGGHFLFQPLFVTDLAQIILACPFSPSSAAKAITCAGPDTIELCQYFQSAYAILHDSTDTQEAPDFPETTVADYLQAHPEAASYLCHRIYTHESLQKNQLPVPKISFSDGIAMTR